MFIHINSNKTALCIFQKTFLSIFNFKSTYFIVVLLDYVVLELRALVRHKKEYLSRKTSVQCYKIVIFFTHSIIKKKDLKNNR